MAYNGPLGFSIRVASIVLSDLSFGGKVLAIIRLMGYMLPRKRRAKDKARDEKDDRSIKDTKIEREKIEKARKIKRGKSKVSVDKSQTVLNDKREALALAQKFISWLKTELREDKLGNLARKSAFTQKVQNYPGTGYGYYTGELMNHFRIKENGKSSYVVYMDDEALETHPGKSSTVPASYALRRMEEGFSMPVTRYMRWYFKKYHEISIPPTKGSLVVNPQPVIKPAMDMFAKMHSSSVGGKTVYINRVHYKLYIRVTSR